METRFDKKLAGMETRFDKKLVNMESRLDKKIDATNQKVENIEKQLDNTNQNMQAQFARQEAMIAEIRRNMVTPT